MITEILYQAKVFANENISKERKLVFMYPYYFLVRERVAKNIFKNSFIQGDDIVEQITYQIVSYAYEKFFKFVYPYEYRLAKENSLLEGHTEKEQNQFFIQSLSSKEEWIQYCFDKYPKLGNMLESYTEGILDYLNELLYSLDNDYKQLNSYFYLEESIAKEICILEGDLHNGKCVSSITFQNGVKLYYKPRGAANEKFLLDVISCLTSMGLTINMGVPSFLDKGKYSWHLHIATKEMTCKKEIKGYYQNLGKLQGLFYLLGTQDIIPDNLLCVGGCPYIIDCESVTSKVFKHMDSSKLSMYLQESVLQTGILPDWMFNDANERTQISSVLFEFGTTNNHLPKINGKQFPITEITLQDLKEGFTESCNFFRNHNGEILKFLNSYDTTGLSARILLHPTIIYSHLLREMVTPPYLHGTKSIKELVKPIIRKESYGDLCERLITSIVNQIESGNIPYYYTKSCDQALYTLPNSSVVEKWTTSDMNGVTPIKKRLSLLTIKRQQEQLLIIDETVNFFIDVIGEKTKKERLSPTEEREINHQDIRHAVERIDKEIQKRMIEIDDEIGFVCRTKNSFDGKFQVCLMNDSMYDGMLGICLFYRTLYNYSHSINHKRIASRIFKQLCKNWKESYYGIDLSTVPISPLSGITGLLYIMERFPDFYNRSTYTSVINEVKRLIPTTTQYDYMSGLAGLILLVVQCKFMGGDDKQAILKECAERIRQLATTKKDVTYWTYTDGNKITGEKQMVLGGFAHGSSSMALAMFQLAKHLKDRRYYNMFCQSLLHDRSFYSEEVKGWIDGRDPLSKGDSGSWCHGATGIALSRLFLCSEGYEDSGIEQELSLAIGQIERRIGYNLSICHGSMGNLEVLKSISSQFFRERICCTEWINAIARYISNGKDIVCGDDNRNSQVGLFMGFAGIGYQLLRFHDWENVPSIICLETAPTTKLLH